MGTEYYAINKSNKTFYYLGKGNWYDLNHDKECFQDLEYLIDEILEIVFNFNKELDIINHVTNKVAPALFELFKDCNPKDIEILNDCGDEITLIKCLKYKCIGVRYGNIDYYNRQFIDDDFCKRIYNLEDIKRYFTEERFNEFK